MVTTDSLKLYNKACQYGKNSRKQYSHKQSSHKQSSLLSPNNNTGRNQNIDLKAYYVQIISTMFHELITKKSSNLLSHLCSVNNIQVDVVNFNIMAPSGTYQCTYDILPILEGINTAFTKSLAECGNLFPGYQGKIFQDKGFEEDFDHVSWITSALKTLDDNIGRALSVPMQSPKEPDPESNGSKTKETDPARILPIANLNQLAKDRRARDAALLEQLQQLQISLQDELKQIMLIREGIDYEITQEAINQFLLLFSLVGETLQYHPNKNNKDSYNNLIESCENFLDHIKQSLAMLGVEIIEDVGKPFNGERHKPPRGIQPTRQDVILKVVKIGFAYKNKVLEKAVVELDLAHRS